MPRYDLFFSYRHHDLARALPLLEALRALNLRVWFDETAIPDHAAISQQIRQGIAESKSLLAFYSATYPQSRPCQMELTTAWLAAQTSGDPASDRILILNPESSTTHIPKVLRSDKMPAWPTDPADLTTLAHTIAKHIRRIKGPLPGAINFPLTLNIVAASRTDRFVGRSDDFQPVRF